MFKMLRSFLVRQTANRLYDDNILEQKRFRAKIKSMQKILKTDAGHAAVLVPKMSDAELYRLQHIIRDELRLRAFEQATSPNTKTRYH